MSGKLRLNGATSGYSELQAPDVAGDQTFTLPAVGGELVVAVTRPFFYAKPAMLRNDNTPGQTIEYDQEVHDFGNNYDSATSTFTVPQDGIYQFSGQFFAGAGPGNVSSGALDLYIGSGARPRFGREFTTDNYSSHAITWSGFLNQGDTAYIKLFTGTIHTNINYSFFSGCLIS